MNKKELRQGFLQALGVVGYCGVIAFIVFNEYKIFGNMNNYFGPLAFLTLFSTSALTCSLLVFYKPYKLFFDGKKKEAVDTVVATAVSLFGFLIIFFGVLAFVK